MPNGFIFTPDGDINLRYVVRVKPSVHSEPGRELVTLLLANGESITVPEADYMAAINEAVPVVIRLPEGEEDLDFDTLLNALVTALLNAQAAVDVVRRRQAGPTE